MSTTGGPPAKPPPPASARGGGGAVEPTVRADATLTASDIQELTAFAEGLKYAGFSTKHIRTIIVGTIPAKDLLKILVAARLLGNNPSRASGKVVDPKVGRAALDLFKAYNIKGAGALGVNDLTLARIMASCAPLTHAIGLKIHDQLQSQGLGTRLPVEWQTPSLAVYSDREYIPDFKEWLLAFAMQIKPKAEDPKMTEQRTLQFRDIAIGNRGGDSFLNPDNLGKSIPDLISIMYGA